MKQVLYTCVCVCVCVEFVEQADGSMTVREDASACFVLCVVFCVVYSLSIHCVLVYIYTLRLFVCVFRALVGHSFDVCLSQCVCVCVSVRVSVCVCASVCVSVCVCVSVFIIIILIILLVVSPSVPYVQHCSVTV